MQVVTLPLPKRILGVVGLTYGLVATALGRRNIGGKTPGPFREFRPDIVHVFKPVGYSGLAGLALTALRVPWALDTDDWEGPGGWADVNPYSPAQRLALTLMEAGLPRLTGAVTAASRTLEARAWDFGLPRRRVFYMPNGVSRARYGGWLASTSTPPPSPPTLLLYTRFAEFPYRWPLQVLAQVRRVYPEAKLLVVGAGFFGEEAELVREAGAMGLADAVTATGRVPESDIPGLLRQGTVALYPMLDNLINRAKSPVKLLEQMVMALPIVAHRVGQTPHFLGEAGVLVEAGDVVGMAEAAIALLSDPQRRKRLGEEARWRVWAEFNWERLAEVAERAYATALGEK